MIVRAIMPDDRAAWEELWTGYLSFYEVDLSEEVTESTWSRIIGRNDGFFALIAENKTGAVVGFAHCLMHFNTWGIAPRCYLEDLFVCDVERGNGVGRALIDALCVEAKAHGANQVYWFTDQGNTNARYLYDKIGTLSDFVRYDKNL